MSEVTSGEGPSPSGGTQISREPGAALAGAAVLLAAALAPVLFNPWSQRVFESDKLALLGLLAAAALGGLALVPRPWLPPRPLGPVLWGLALSGVLSGFFSLNPSDSWWGSAERGLGLFSLAALLGLAATAARVMPPGDLFLRVLVAASLPVSLFALVQKAGLDPLWGAQLGRRVGSTMGNPVLLGAWLVMVLPLTALAAWRAPTSRTRAAALVALALQALALLFTGARGATLGLVAGVVFALLVAGLPALRRPRPVEALLALVVPAFAAFLGFGLARLVLRGCAVHEPTLGVASAAGALLAVLGTLAFHLRSPQGRGWVPWGGVVVALGCLVGLLILNIPPARLARLSEVPGVGRALVPLVSVQRLPALERLGRLTDFGGRTGQVRRYVWEGTLNLLLSPRPLRDAEGRPDPHFHLRPLLGYGPETLRLAFLSFHPPELGRVEKRSSYVDRAHNQSLDLLATQGVLGFASWQALYLALVLMAARRLGRALARGDGWRLAGAWFGGGLLAALLVASRWEPVLAVPAWMAGALSGGLLFLLARRPSGMIPDPLGPAALLAAVVAHAVEVQFGFSTAASTSLLFLLAGWLAAPTLGGGERASIPTGPASEETPAGWILGALLAALGVCFSSLPGLPAVVLGLLVLTWLGGSALWPRSGRVVVLSAGTGLAGLVGLWGMRLALAAPGGETLLPAAVVAVALGLAALVLGTTRGLATLGGAAPLRRSPGPSRILAFGLVLLLPAALGVRQVQAGLALRRAGELQAREARGATANPGSVAWLRTAADLSGGRSAYLHELARGCLGQASRSASGSARAGLQSEAERLLEDLARVLPWDPAVCALRGDLALQRAIDQPQRRDHFLEEARRHLQATVALAPAGVLTRNRIARNLLLAGGSAQEAIAAYEASLLRDPDLAESWSGLAEACLVAAMASRAPHQGALLARSGEALLAGARRLRNQAEAADWRARASRLLERAGQPERAAHAWRLGEEAGLPTWQTRQALERAARLYRAAGWWNLARNREQQASRAPEAARPSRPVHSAPPAAGRQAPSSTAPGPAGLDPAGRP